MIDVNLQLVLPHMQVLCLTSKTIREKWTTLCCEDVPGQLCIVGRLKCFFKISLPAAPCFVAEYG